MYEQLMIEKRCEMEIKEHALKAISELSFVLNAVQHRCSQQDLEWVRVGVGRAIGTIQSELLEPVYEAHPELDDLR
jgi:hypothetical protein